MARNRNRANHDGSFYQTAEGLWRGVAYVRTPSGKVKRKYVSSMDRDTAHQKWVALVGKAQSGQPITVSAQRVDAYLAYWLNEVVKPGLRHNTYAMYETFVRLYINPAIGSKRIDRLQVADVRRLLNKMKTDGASPRKVQAARAVLRSALSNAMTEELISRNVASLVKVARPPRRRITGWEPEEARTFLSAAIGRVLFAAYVITLTLGLRRGEVLGIGWNDVNLDVGELHVRWQIQRADGKLVRVPVKTDGSDSVIPLPKITVNALRVRKAEQDAERKKANENEDAKKRWKDANGWNLVFTTATGGPIDPRNFNTAFHAVCKKAGVRKIRVHDTRHTCASLLRSLGVDLSVIKEILRHSQIAMTADIYVHVTTKQQREAVSLVGEVLELTAG